MTTWVVAKMFPSPAARLSDRSQPAQSCPTCSPPQCVVRSRPHDGEDDDELPLTSLPIANAQEGDVGIVGGASASGGAEVVPVGGASASGGAEVVPVEATAAAVDAACAAVVAERSVIGVKSNGRY